MFKKIVNFGCLKLLLLICCMSAAEASSFYDLKEDIVRNFAHEELPSLSYTKSAYMASDNFHFSPQFLDQTQKLIEREAVFRHKCSIAEGTNVAQLCIYGTYNNSDDWKFIEIFDPKSCKGHFYLSGNEPVLLSQEKPSSRSPSIDVQKIGHEKGYMEIRQRPQPLLATIKHTVQFLEGIREFVENPTNQAQELANLAAAKNKEIMGLTTRKDGIIKALRRQVEQYKEFLQQEASTSISASIPLIESTQKFMTGMLGELIMCLEGDDFNFNGMKDTKNNENLKEYIRSIHKQLSERKLDELLNSKYFNMGCSEPILLFDLLGDELTRDNLIRKVSKNLFSDQLESIVVQLHSTKTPCISCLIGCCGHAQNEGLIESFFKVIRQEVKTSLGRENVNLRFLISYCAPYKDLYPFYIPVVSDLSLPLNSILIVNMQLYEKEFRRIKERIVKEEHLKIESLLLQKLKEKNSLTSDDIKEICK